MVRVHVTEVGHIQPAIPRRSLHWVLLVPSDPVVPDVARYLWVAPSRRLLGAFEYLHAVVELVDHINPVVRGGHGDTRRIFELDFRKGFSAR